MLNADENKLIEYCIGYLDEKINSGVNAVLHHPKFQELESAWRGLWMVATAAHVSQRVVVRLLDVSLKELDKDVNQAVEFDQSQLFKKIYTEEFDHPGGRPYGLLIGDYYFSHKSTLDVPDSPRLLLEIAKIASAAFVPFVSAISPHVFGVNHFNELKIPLRLDDLFQLAEYQRWKNVRQEDDVRYLGLVLPRILMRTPYNRHGIKTGNLFFQEEINQHTDYLWGNASYAYACVVIKCFIESGWFSNIRGVNSEVLADGSVNIVRDYFCVDQQRIMPKGSAEYLFTDTQERILSDAGFITLCDHAWLGESVFYSSQSLQVPRRYSTKAGTVNAQLSSMLHYLLCVARFVHYIKIIMRDKIGSFVNAKECEQYLHAWVHRYCSASYSDSSEARARYPLSDAIVKIEEVKGAPGKYHCTMHLKPHYQLDQLQTHLKLVTHVKL